MSAAFSPAPPSIWSARSTAWIRRRLFPDVMSVVATIVAIALVASIAPGLFRWALLDADFAGVQASDCSGAGACWVFVKTHLGQFLYGFYPEAERWRIDVAAALAPLATALVVVLVRKARLVSALAVVLVALGLVRWLVAGGLGLKPVSTDQWGGLFVTLLLAALGMAVSLPVGTALAVGRSTGNPAIRAPCAVFIEVFRGVPLIAILFMAVVMLPLLIPGGADANLFVRVAIGICIYAAAYMAEVVRGGLQAIPRGQVEAAKAMGLSRWHTLRFVVLPQALRLSLPGIVNTLIALVKDTTLVLIIGVFDLLGIVQVAVTDPKWLRVIWEGYAFAGGVYFLICFALSQSSRYLERRLSRGAGGGGRVGGRAAA